VPRRWGE